MEYLLSDSHTDFMTEINTRQARENYIAGIKDLAVYIGASIFTTEKRLGIRDIQNYAEEIKFYNEECGTNLLLTIEDISFIKTMSELNALVELHPFSVTLTWNNANLFAGGADSQMGLTTLGENIIKILESNNVLVDTAHLSKLAFERFASISTKPIFNSHSNIFSLHPHNRNLLDKQIEKIVESNGYLGITLYRKFISNSSISAKDVARQITYLINNFGDSNFGLGTDLYGINSKYLPTDINCIEDTKKVAQALLEMGYSHEIVNKIMFKNFIDFVERIEVLF